MVNKYKICPQCDFFSNIGEAGSFCPKCGEKLIDKCEKCGKEITNPYDSYCKHCGNLYPGRSNKKEINF
ncbi:MAG: zinc ribbon domain-containing protein [Candidatus Marinimicrobia bacterium]|nr:zinc ribbon domain-containing protein [Candidatus Neomarinimicrobiota bacterium]